MSSREQWLIDAKEELRKKYFTGKRAFSTNINVSIGIPTGSARAIGECWDRSLSKDGKTTNIFICPTIESPILVLATLAHELVHAVVGNAAKHGPEFKRVAVAIGLTGKMTATVPSEGMIRELREINNHLGTYPHIPMTKTKPKIAKKQTRSLVLVSKEDPDYQIRISEKILEQYEGKVPTDPWGVPMILKEALDG